MRRPKILVVGSFVMDLIVRSSRFVGAGETILGLDYQTASGGKGANQAVQAARLGAEVTMLGKVGDDAFGREMIASLREAGVNVDKVIATKEAPSAVGNVQIQENESGTQNRIVVVPGANMSLRVEEVAFLEKEIQAYDMVMMQLEIPMAVNEAVARYAHAAHVPVMLNPAPSAPLSPQLLQQIAYLSPNEHEAADLVGFEVKREEACRKAMEALRGRGVQNVLITRGEEGSAYSGADQVLFSPCVRCGHVADPTAAGDSFVAAFCVAICAGLPAGDALTFASHTACITVSRMGAQPSLPTLAEVWEQMEQKQVKMDAFAALR
ncbi:MAG: ribokinase [Candidatus Limiplasma sp.]|nr:ribokinase [Candidatus Limiplasma sp.]